MNETSKMTTSSLAAEIAVAIAGIPRDDYWGLIREINIVLSKFGISNRQSLKRV